MFSEPPLLCFSHMASLLCCHLSMLPYGFSPIFLLSPLSWTCHPLFFVSGSSSTKFPYQRERERKLEVIRGKWCPAKRLEVVTPGNMLWKVMCSNPGESRMSVLHMCGWATAPRVCVVKSQTVSIQTGVLNKYIFRFPTA